METTQDQKDDLAEVVMERYRRAKEYREGHIVHQGLSFDTLINRAEHQYRREYTSQDSAEMTDSFGFVPTRYLGIVQQKVNATQAWTNDLVVNNLDSMFTVTPSPNPTLDKKSLDRIREGVRQELRVKMANAGIADASLLLDTNGKPSHRIENYLIEQVMALKQVEQSRIVSLASSSAKTIQTHMRDLMIEGNFRQAFSMYTFERSLTGIGIMKFPDWRRKPLLAHAQGGGAKLSWQTVPWFRHVRVKDFYPIADAIDYQTNTGNTEFTYVTKSELINMARQKHYFTDVIEDIIEDYAYKTRNWIDGDGQDDQWWNLDETIPFMIHEGFFSGDELREYGITGLDTLDYVSAHIEVCGNRTVRCQLIGMPGGANERSYYGSPFNKIGDNLYDVLGMGAMLWDSEQRVNRIMHLFEHNIDWASRPPIMTNPNTFENSSDARNVVPGGQYTVEDRFGASAALPEPMRPMQPVSAQYHLLMSQVGAILRQADEDCGIPAFAYGAQDFGKSSLGEYSQRMTNALRTIKQAALNEDIYFIEPAFRGMFNHLMVTEKDLASGQDVNVMIRGMTGLLKEDQTIQRQQSVLPMLLQPGAQAVVPEMAVKYAVRQMLEQAGFPVDALGMSDPQIDNALAIAAGQPLPGSTPGGPQVPKVDGRSGGQAVANTASPSGASSISIPAPSL
jgi:hypothetical protein